MFKFEFAMNSGSFHSGQFYIIQIIKGLNWFDQPVVWNVVMHSENGFLRQIIELCDWSCGNKNCSQKEYSKKHNFVNIVTITYVSQTKIH